MLNEPLDKRFTAASRMLKALSHELRLEIVCGLRSKPCTQTFIAQTLDLPQSTVAQHLKVLRESGFANVRVDGARRIYSLEPSGLADIDQWLAQFRRFWEPKFAALAKEVEGGKKKRKKKRGLLARSLWNAIVAVVLLLGATVLVVLPWRWISPPTSAFVIRARIAGSRTTIDWVDWDQISVNLPIAVVAAEDLVVAHPDEAEDVGVRLN